jgi:transcriptional regulator with XRE-family HTH domain
VTAADQQLLASRLRETREMLNVSQQFVAEHTGISRSAISEIERGSRKVDSLELKRLADLYRFPVSYFLGEIDEEKGAGAETVQALTRAAEDLSEDDRQQMLRFAVFLRGFKESEKK